MTCTITKIPGGFIATCTRGQPARAPCSTCKSQPHEKLCDFPLRGESAGRTCDAKLCANCAVNVGADRDLCPAHARLEKAAAAQTTLKID